MPIQRSPYITGSYPVLDSSQMALSNLAGGDLYGAGLSLTLPQEASPEERKKLSERMGLKGPLASIVDISTNPLVLIGAALTYKFGIPSVGKLLTVQEGKEGLRRSLIPLLEKLSGPREIFRGTQVPADLELASRRHIETVLRMQEKLLDATKEFGGDISEESWRKIAAHLDGIDDPSVAVQRRGFSILRDKLRDAEAVKLMGLNASEAEAIASKLEATAPIRITLTEQERKVADGLKGFFSDAWENVLSKVKSNDEAKEFLEVMGFSAPADGVSGIQALEKFWPHMMETTVHQTSENLDQYITAKYRVLMSKDMVGNPANVAKEVVQSARYKIGGRSGALLPKAEDLKALGVDDDIVRAVTAYSNTFMGGKGYTLSAGEVLPRYADTVGRVFAWALPTSEGKGVSIAQRMSEHIQTFLSDKSPTSVNKANMLRNTYIPLVLGRIPASQLAWSAGWEELKQNSISFLQGPAKKLLGEDMANRWSSHILNDRSFSYPAVGQSIANFFHLSTLGGNAVSASLNLLQPFTTLIPTIGLKATGQGYAKVMNALPKVFEELSAGRSPRAALEKMFPEFYAQHLELDPVMRQEVEQTLAESYQSALKVPEGVKSKAKWVQDRMMSLFSTTESVNRLAAFYGSRARAMEGLIGHRYYDPVLRDYVTVTKENVGKYADDWARVNTERTQYGSGPLQRPALTAKWWAPLRQFTTYPLRTAGLFLNEATRNPGILGAGLLGGGLVYGAGREFLGQDLSRGLIFGGMPRPGEPGDVGFPSPIVPPFLQVVGSSFQSLAGAGNENLQKSLPLLVPGGVEAARLTSVVPGLGEAAKFLGRPQADYSRRTPDGRVPVVSGTGSLIGYFTPQQLFLQAMGFRTATQVQEQELTKMVIANRERIRKMKRDYLAAMYDNDVGDAARINAEWERAFPNMGPLPITKADVQALHMRRDVARLERTMQTLPADARPAFSAMIGTTVASNFPQFMGLMSPEADFTIPAGQREPYRAFPRKGVEEVLRQNAGQPQSLHGVKLRDKMGLRGQADEAQQNSAFTAFGEF